MLKALWLSAIMASMISLSAGFCYADKGAAATPELAAKKENVRKQQEQRITPEKRKAAIEARKAERIRLYKAKQDAKAAAPDANITNLPNTQK
jgi:hypothetical protein